MAVGTEGEVEVFGWIIGNEMNEIWVDEVSDGEAMRGLAKCVERKPVSEISFRILEDARRGKAEKNLEIKSFVGDDVINVAEVMKVGTDEAGFFTKLTGAGTKWGFAGFDFAAGEVNEANGAVGFVSDAKGLVILQDDNADGEADFFGRIHIIISLVKL